jgi:hypothetical protein
LGWYSGRLIPSVSLTCVLVGAIVEEVNLTEKKQWQGFLRLFDSFFVNSPQVDRALHPIGIDADHDLDDFRVIAATELEKGEKGPHALASERRAA